MGNTRKNRHELVAEYYNKYGELVSWIQAFSDDINADAYSILKDMGGREEAVLEMNESIVRLCEKTQREIAIAMGFQKEDTAIDADSEVFDINDYRHVSPSDVGQPVMCSNDVCILSTKSWTQQIYVGALDGDDDDGRMHDRGVRYVTKSTQDATRLNICAHVFIKK